VKRKPRSEVVTSPESRQYYDADGTQSPDDDVIYDDVLTNDGVMTSDNYQSLDDYQSLQLHQLQDPATYSQLTSNARDD